MTTPAHSRSPTLAEVLRAAFDARLSELHVALPGKVEKYDATSQKADIKPLLKRRIATAEGGELLEALPVITDVPILFPRSGQFFLSFPLQVGDHVLLVFTDRSLDNFLLGSGADTDPDDFRTHDLSDAVALPAFYPFGKALTSVHDANLVLGKDGGPQVHVDGSVVHLGEFPAAQFVALAQKVLDELNSVKADLDSVKATFDAHTHILTLAAAAGAGGTGTAAPPLSPIPAPHTPASVAATKAKAT